MRMALAITAVLFAVLAVVYCITLFMGDGAFKRAVTVSGVYPVGVPYKGRDYVCFLDADSKQGGLSCLAVQP